MIEAIDIIVNRIDNWLTRKRSGDTIMWCSICKKGTSEGFEQISYLLAQITCPQRRRSIHCLQSLHLFYIVEKLLSTRVFMWLLRLSFEGDEKSHWLHCFPPLSRSHRVEEEGRRLGRARTAPTFILQSSPPPGGGGDGAENYGDGGEKYGDGNQDQRDWGQWQINLAEFCSHS